MKFVDTNNNENSLENRKILLPGVEGGKLTSKTVEGKEDHRGVPGKIVLTKQHHSTQP